MNVNFFRQAQSRRFQHGGPEQRVEISDILTDEMMDFGGRTFPPVNQFFVVLFTPFGCRPDVTDRCIEPDVPIVSRTVGNFKTEIR